MSGGVVLGKRDVSKVDNAPAGKVRLFFDEDGQLVFKDDAGAVAKPQALIEDLEALVATKQDASGAATDSELASAVAALTTAINAKQDSSSAATDAELASAVSTLNAAIALKQEASSAATDAELASEQSAREAADALKLAKGSNLSDVASASTSRTNLGLGTAATKDSGAAGEAGKVLASDDPSLIRNVKNFGAKGDGATNDIAAIQAAVDAAAEAGGGIVFFPRGTYIVGTAIVIKDRVTLAGEGFASSIIKLKNGANTDVMVTEGFSGLTGTDKAEGPRDWEVRNLRIEGNKANNASGHGMKLYGYRFRLSNLRITNCKNDGIHSESFSAANIPGNPERDTEAEIDNVRTVNCDGYGVYWGGPHDTQFNEVTTVSSPSGSLGGFKIVSPGFTNKFVNCHAWGPAPYAWYFDTAAGNQHCVNCEAEGGTTAQIYTDSVAIWWNGGSIFPGGGTANTRTGIVFGPNSFNHYFDVYFRDLLYDCDFNAGDAGNSTIKGQSKSSAESFTVTGAPAKSIVWGIQAYGSKVDSFPLKAVAAAANIDPGVRTAIQVTGNTNITSITVHRAESVLTLEFTGTPKVVNGSNLKLQGDFQASAGAILRLICDGTNWEEAGRIDPAGTAEGQYRPSDMGLLACSVNDPSTAAQTMQPTAKTVYLTKLKGGRNIPSAKRVRYLISQAATAEIEGCYFGLIDQLGVLRAKTTDRKADFQSTGEKSAEFTPVEGQNLEFHKGEYFYVALLVAKQGTTAVQLRVGTSTAAATNFGMTAAGLPLRHGSIATEKTEVPAGPFTLGELVSTQGPVVYGVTA